MDITLTPIWKRRRHQSKPESGNKVEHDSTKTLTIRSTPQGRTTYWRKKKAQERSPTSANEDLPFEEVVIAFLGEETPGTKDLSREVLMVHITEIDESDDSLEHLNLENMTRWISTNSSPTTTWMLRWRLQLPRQLQRWRLTSTPTLTPTPSVTITVKMDNNNDNERRRIRNQKHTIRRHSVTKRYKDQDCESYDYSNHDLRNIINIGRDASNVIISKRQKREKAEAYVLLPTIASQRTTQR